MRFSQAGDECLHAGQQPAVVIIRVELRPHLTGHFADQTIGQGGLRRPAELRKELSAVRGNDKQQSFSR